MLSHKELDHYKFEEVPLKRDIFLMQEKWLPDYEQYIDDVYLGKQPDPVGYISYACIQSISDDHLEISWYPNIHDRFHEVALKLPKSKFICCVGCRDFDEDPRIFVTDDWIDDLYKRPYSAFALVDAIGVKEALNSGDLTELKLLALRNSLDKIAEDNPGIAILSFADNVLIKSDWTVGAFDNEISYTYTPEKLIDIVGVTFQAFKNNIGLDCYACITQGFNEYSDGKVIHSSRSGNHISLNSLGLPFAQLMNIDCSVRNAIKSKQHERYQLYLDSNYYRSLQWKYEFDRPEGAHTSPMSRSHGSYYCLNLDAVCRNLKAATPNSHSTKRLKRTG